MIYQQLNAKESVTLTQEEYDNLSAAEKNNGTTYFISNSSEFYMSADDIEATDVDGNDSNVQDVLDDMATSIEEVKVLSIEVASFSSLPQTVNNAAITADHVVMHSVLGTPSAQTGDWTVTTTAGSLTISGSISGSTTLTLYLLKKQV